MENTNKIETNIISKNSFSAIETTVEVQLLQFSSGKELWINTEENRALTFNMNEAIRLLNYLNSLDLK